MGVIDLHSKPFDDETITKLEIFENYTQEWLPTFIMSGSKELHIFDFFAGTGYDKNGVPGSPIRILEKIKKHTGQLFQHNVKIKLHLNEFEPNKKQQVKFELLQNSCREYLDKNPSLKHIVGDPLYKNEDFGTLFPKLLPLIKQYPSLVFLDQNGIKFTSEKYFLELEKTSQTDFLYFISSSYFWRFGNEQEFKMHMNIDMGEAKKDPYKHIHRNILLQLRKKLPLETKLRLYPFSIKKDPNIHGIIFGASHPRAVDKFLKVAWAKNTTNGQANFDIDDDNAKQQVDMFLGVRKNKIQAFQEEVKKRILNREITTNAQLYSYTIQEGHICLHSTQIVKEMKNKEITYDCSSPLINYDNVHKKPRLLEYTLIKK